MNSSTAEDAEDADSELPASDPSLITYRSKPFQLLSYADPPGKSTAPL